MSVVIDNDIFMANIFRLGWEIAFRMGVTYEVVLMGRRINKGLLCFDG